MRFANDQSAEKQDSRALSDGPRKYQEPNLAQPTRRRRQDEVVLFGFHYLLQERHFVLEVLESVHFVLQMVDLISSYHKTNYEHDRKDCNHSPH